MAGSRHDFGVHKAAGGELRAGFLGGVLEGEVRELGQGRVRRQGAVVVVRRGMMDDRDDKVVRCGGVLLGRKKGERQWLIRRAFLFFFSFFLSI